MNRIAAPSVPFIDLDLLNTLVAIAEGGSFSAAAAEVGRTPSAVSMQVKKLEDILGRPVFIRDSRKVSLTLDGELLLEHARRMLALNREVVSRFIAPEVTGQVRLAAPDDVAERFLPDMLSNFAASYPGVAVTVAIGGTNEMVEGFRKGRIDLALVTMESAGEVAHLTDEVMVEEIVWAVKRGGIAVEQDPLPISVWDENCPWRAACITGLKRDGRAWRIAFQSAHTSAQKAAIMADLAVSVLPRSALTDDIIEAAPEYGLPPLPLYRLGLLAKDNPSAHVQVAGDHLRESFQRLAPQALMSLGESITT